MRSELKWTSYSVAYSVSMSERVKNSGAPVRALGHRKFPARVYRRNMLGGNSSRDPGRLSEFENVSCPQSPTFVSPRTCPG